MSEKIPIADKRFIESDATNDTVKRVKEALQSEGLKGRESAIKHAWDAQSNLTEVSGDLFNVPGMEDVRVEAIDLAEKVGELFKKLNQET